MKKGRKTTSMRMMTMAALLATVVVAAFWHSGLGALSGFGIWSVAAICPLGFLETALAARGFVPWLLLPFLIIAVVTALYGRVFCGWICPVPLVRSWLPGGDGRPPAKSNGNGNGNGGGKGNGNGSGNGANAADAISEPARAWPALSVLAGTLVSSSIFGFPVFCLVCPVGLVFATGFAAVHLLRTGQPSFDLLVFPAVVILELVVFRKWCARLCPLGALLGLFALFHRGLVPRIDHSRCLVDTKGSRCRECQKACEFDIDLRQPAPVGGVNECTKCRVCADNCPAKAISFPWWSR
jgi:ferredoxin-type protein NapH